MRLFFWLFVVALLACLVFSGAQAISNYFEAMRVVDDAVDREKPNLAEQMIQGRWRLASSDHARKIREHIVKAVADADLPVDPSNVMVSEEREGVVNVRITWTQPMVTVRGEQFLLLPITLTRTYDLEARAK